MNRERREVLKKWKEVGWQGWWGDSIDVRFHLAKCLSEVEGKRILDIGCGPGIILSQAKSENIARVGLDMATDKLKMAKIVCPGGYWIKADMLHQPFRPESFDLIVLGGVLELIENKREFLHNLWSLVDAGGKILLTTPNRSHWAFNSYEKTMTLAELQGVLDSFQQVRIVGYNPTPSLFYFLPGFIKRKVPASLVPLMFVPSPVMARLPGISWIMEKLMDWTPGLKFGKTFFVEIQK